jgi:hypothetical protein
MKQHYKALAKLADRAETLREQLAALAAEVEEATDALREAADAKSERWQDTDAGAAAADVLEAAEALQAWLEGMEDAGEASDTKAAADAAL